MKIIDIKQIPFYVRLLNILFTPVMFLIAGLKRDSIQETHTWNTLPVNPENIDLSLCVFVKGDEKTFYKGRGVILFHLPLLGGWKKYSVYEVSKENIPFYIGWICYNKSDEKVIECAMQRLPIYQNTIRLLDGSHELYGYRFALNKQGMQIPIKITGNGILGDHKFLSTRLF